MDKKRFFGFTLALAGILLALSHVALTGAVIGETKSSMLGVVAAILTISGIVLVLAEAGAKRYGVEDIVENYESRRMSPLAAIAQIDQRLGGVIGVILDQNKSENAVNIQTNRGTVHLEFDNALEAEELALAAFVTARARDYKNVRRCKFHGPEYSSKHYKADLIRRVREFSERYGVNR